MENAGSRQKAIDFSGHDRYIGPKLFENETQYSHRLYIGTRAFLSIFQWRTLEWIWVWKAKELS